jgi:hypothetical protein
MTNASRVAWPHDESNTVPTLKPPLSMHGDSRTPAPWSGSLEQGAGRLLSNWHADARGFSSR